MLYADDMQVHKSCNLNDLASAIHCVEKCASDIKNTIAFCIIKQRARENMDIIGMPCIQDENGNLKTDIGERLEVWRRYCKRLKNVEIDWD